MGLAKLINGTDTAANWASLNPVLADGEIGYATDTHLIKIGDGVTAWNLLKGVNEVLLGTAIALPRVMCYPEALNFIANYEVESVFDATWARGSKVGTAVNSPMVIYGFLTLENGVPLAQYVDYDAEGNVDSAIQTGCIRFDFFPPSVPGSVYYDTKVFGILDSDESQKNRLELVFYNNSNEYGITLVVHDKDGVEAIYQDFGTWTEYEPGIPYEFELNWDLTTGASRLFINGVQFGDTITGTCERDANVHIFRMGCGYDPSSFSSAHKVDNVKVFDEVQHTSDYTPGAGDPVNLPEIFSGYIICAGGVVDNTNSPYHGFPVVDKSGDQDFVWAWKIID